MHYNVCMLLIYIISCLLAGLFLIYYEYKELHTNSKAVCTLQNVIIGIACTFVPFVNTIVAVMLVGFLVCEESSHIILFRGKRPRD